MSTWGIGSSPRVWGIRFSSSSRASRCRFIPTRVGNTSWHCPSPRHPPVHPHACGEYMDGVTPPMMTPGSSPRVWGIHSPPPGPRRERRFIPTRVGNTLLQHGSNDMHPVHPHACGEYDDDGQDEHALSGSSPRVWGIPWQDGIPSRANPVHPHACGEYLKVIFIGIEIHGSSPRVWGILTRTAGASHGPRFIPTRVGNTLQEDARNNRLLAELQRATEPCVLQACSDDDKKGKELCKAAPSPRKTLPGRAVTLS